MQGLSFKAACAVTAAAALVLGHGASLEAQTNPRSTFPGRRVGGGTRGECNARTLVHLVPESSVFAPGADGTLALVQGPTVNPVSLTMRFEPEAGGVPTRQTLQAASAGLTLISGAAVATSTVWESSFDCSSADASGGADPLSFVQSSSPPALSLLLPEAEASDQLVQSVLSSLRLRCGATVPAKETLAQFGLADLVTEEWPQQLPVRCPS